MLDPILLRTFLAVERTGSFTAAADTLGLRQSTVSGHVARLEHATRQTLFLRSSGRRTSVTTTAAGGVLTEHAGRILAAHEAATTFFSAPRASGSVRFGTTEDLLAGPVPVVLRNFGQEHPDVTLELVVDDDAQQLRRRLGTHDIDSALMACRPASSAGTVVGHDRLVWARAPHSRCPSRSRESVVVYLPPTWVRDAAIEVLNLGGYDYRTPTEVCSRREAHLASLAGVGYSVYASTSIPGGLEEATRLPELPSVDFVVEHSGPADAPTTALNDYIERHFRWELPRNRGTYV